MNREAISTIETHVPGAIHRLRPDTAWPEGLIVTRADADLKREIEDALYGDEAPTAEMQLIDDDDVASVPDAPRAQPGLFDEDGIPTLPEAEPPEIMGALRDHFGADWPGSPGGAGSGRTRRPNSDAYAFYLPWHRFHPDIWGIYLTVEGIEALGSDIHTLAGQWLSPPEARRAATLFLYHHEAYHNAVETFAARLEASHRKPSYIPGVQAAAQYMLAETGLHEEGLANHYAWTKLREGFLEDQSPKPPKVVLDRKRKAAANALERIIGNMDARYASAMRIIDGPVSFDEAESELQEFCHCLSNFGVPPAAKELWQAAPYALYPSLGRNRRFSYVISRQHSIWLERANVPRFSRREVVRRLRAAAGVTEEGGGEHPKIVLPDGRRVPLPGHTDISRGTLRSVLREVKISMPVSLFMSLPDRDLKRMGKGAA